MHLAESSLKNYRLRRNMKRKLFVIAAAVSISVAFAQQPAATSGAFAVPAAAGMHTTLVASACPMGIERPRQADVSPEARLAFRALAIWCRDDRLALLPGDRAEPARN